MYHYSYKGLLQEAFIYCSGAGVETVFAGEHKSNIIICVEARGF